MYYDNGISALRGIIASLEAEQKYLQSKLHEALVLQNEAGSIMSYSTAHELLVDSIMQLQHETETIRISAERNKTNIF